MNGKRANVGVGVHDGRQVLVLPMVLKPGERATVDGDVPQRPGQDGDPVLDWTPGMRAAAQRRHGGHRLRLSATCRAG